MRWAARVDWAAEFYSPQNEWCGVYSGDPSGNDHQAAADLARLLGAGAQEVAAALDTLNATAPYANLLGALADLRQRVEEVLK